MTNIKWNILGFNKREVDEHLKQVQSAQEAELEALSEKIKTCQREQDLLEQEFITLTDQNTSFTTMSLLEFALRKVESVAEHIDQTAEADVLAIQKSSQQISSLFEPARWFWGEHSESQTGFSNLEEETEHGTKKVAVTMDIKTKAIEPKAQLQERARQEINAARHKYVLGKIVGENILDDTGKVMISKNEKITASVLKLAHKEGKLTDLIIHMVLAGQEE